MNGRVFAPLLLGAAVSLGGCVSSREPTLSTAPGAAPLTSPGAAPLQARDTNDIVRGRDKISVIVLREPDLTLPDVRVGEDGFFDMPAIGRVKAEGRTTAAIAEEVRERLGRNYLRNPSVAVNVIDYSSHVVTVEGAVEQPGVYQYQPNTTLIGAVAMARGPSRVAKLKHVAIFRFTGGERSVAVFDLAEVRAGTMIDPVLQPGDRVMIGFDGLSQAWRDFLMTAPLIGVFSRI
jgi:polysaccharide export outer membrane protein